MPTNSIDDRKSDFAVIEAPAETSRSTAIASELPRGQKIDPPRIYHREKGRAHHTPHQIKEAGDAEGKIIDKSSATEELRRDILFNCCTNHSPPDWSQFASLEIGGCAYRTDENGGDAWIEGGLCDNEAEFWTIYARLKDGLAEAITGCDTRALASYVPLRRTS